VRKRVYRHNKVQSIPSSQMSDPAADSFRIDWSRLALPRRAGHGAAPSAPAATSAGASAFSFMLPPSLAPPAGLFPTEVLLPASTPPWRPDPVFLAPGEGGTPGEYEACRVELQRVLPRPVLEKGLRTNAEGVSTPFPLFIRRLARSIGIVEPYSLMDECHQILTYARTGGTFDKFLGKRPSTRPARETAAHETEEDMAPENDVAIDGLADAVQGMWWRGDEVVLGTKRPRPPR